MIGNELVTGLSVTRGHLTSPDMTFIWDAVEKGDKLIVTVSYGVGTDTSKISTATINVGTTTPVLMEPTETPPAKVPGVVGSVYAVWSKENKSYAVLFSGQMVTPSVNNLISSDQNGFAKDYHQIIVCAYIDN